MFLGSAMGSSLKAFADTRLDQVFSFRVGERQNMGMTIIHRLFTKMATFQSFLRTVQNRVRLVWVHLEQLRVVEV